MLTSERVHRLIAQEYEALSANWDSKTELIDGVVFDLAPEYVLRAETVERIASILRDALPDLRVFSHGTVRFGNHDDLMSDVFAISSDEELRPDAPIPGELVKLVVEVASTTRQRDFNRKLPRYAAFAVAECWIVDPTTGILTSHEQPAPEAQKYSKVLNHNVGYRCETLDAATALEIFNT